MAMASSAKARNDQIPNTTWCAATATVPMRVATTVAMVSTTRRLSVRSSRGAAAPAEARMAGPVRSQADTASPRAAYNDAREDGRGGELGEHGTQRGSGDAEPDPIHEQDVECDVEEICADGDY